jgi:CDP-diacylglycerol pyrophosphatase
MSLRGVLLAAALLAAAGAARAADPDALRKIVLGQCVPNQVAHGSPLPCAKVDLSGGAARGHVVLKDLVGATQYLVLPTVSLAGIESPQLLAPGAANYFAAAWRERSFTERAAGRALPRDAISLAINSEYARTQNELHIHVDCVRPEVRAALKRQQAAIGESWRPLAALFSGHRYVARRVLGDELEQDPFVLVADGIPGARDNMAAQTIVVVGAAFAGRPGFVILANGDRGGGEELQDHACALARK